MLARRSMFAGLAAALAAPAIIRPGILMPVKPAKITMVAVTFDASDFGDEVPDWGVTILSGGEIKLNSIRAGRLRLDHSAPRIVLPNPIQFPHQPWHRLGW